MNYRSAAGEAVVHERYLELLGQWPVPYEELRVPTREGETFVVACGPVGAAPVLLLRGSGANAATWRRDIAVWAEDFRVYAVDVVGEPGLSAPSRPPLASGAYAGWLDDVLDGLGLSRASLVGVSLGGWLALDDAIRRPDRVERLALLSPSGIGRAKLGILVKAVLLAPFGRWGRRRLLRSAVGAAPGTAGPADDVVLGEFALLIFTHFRPRREVVPIFPDEAAEPGQAQVRLEHARQLRQGEDEHEIEVDLHRGDPAGSPFMSCLRQRGMATERRAPTGSGPARPAMLPGVSYRVAGRGAVHAEGTRSSGVEEMIKRARLFGQKTRVTFALPVDQPAGDVSVVGTFNDWTPGRHLLTPRRNGTRSVSVTLPPGEHRFRYLATGGVWFDDHTADGIDEHAGVIHL